jgi:hypothetical protein
MDDILCEVSDASLRLKVDVARIVKTMALSQARVKPANAEHFQDLYRRMVCLDAFLVSFPKELKLATRNSPLWEGYSQALAHDVLRLVRQLSPAIQVSSTCMTDRHFIKSVRGQLGMACAFSLSAWHHELTEGGFYVDELAAWTLYGKLLRATTCIGADRAWGAGLRRILAAQIRKARFARTRATRRRRNSPADRSHAPALPASGAITAPLAVSKPTPPVMYDLNDSDPDDSV